MGRFSESDQISCLEKEGYTIDRSVLSRFGVLLTRKFPKLLEEHSDLLLAASHPDSSEKKILEIESGSKN